MSGMSATVIRGDCDLRDGLARSLANKRPGQPVIADPAHDDHSSWHRIFGLVHHLCGLDDDGPVSPLRY